MSRNEAIQRASYLLGEGIKDVFEQRENQAVIYGKSYFYVKNSLNRMVRVDMELGGAEEEIVYNVEED